ncbi:MAG: anthranilate synthase component I family protein [Bacteroidota bacterium]|nr:anthranilate synthase component I family protein [Bacteroidota bacterium]
MKKFSIKTNTKQLLADTTTPVNIYLKVRDIFPNSIMLESSDYHGNSNSYSYICLKPVAGFTVENNQIIEEYPDGDCLKTPISKEISVPENMNAFLSSFSNNDHSEYSDINGLFGYTAYDSIQYFETLKIQAPAHKDEYIPEMRYHFYKFIIAINHFKNTLTLIENIFNGEQSEIEKVESLLYNRNFGIFGFKSDNHEQSNITDQQYMDMVQKGIDHCHLGDVFQIVLSRRFSQKYSGDEFNVYRALRSINPSPYLYYFDYGSYKIFGSSPEVQLEIKDGKAYINPIAGTFRRTGDDDKDKELAAKLVLDEKENAEHVMLVDLARNDLSRNSTHVKVETFREVQYYSHVLHLVSRVSGELPEGTNVIRVMANTFPAGTLSGAPKYKAMELINKYENINRSYYGGCIGYIGLNGNFNHAIMIRSFLCKNNTLIYQAGAGIVAASDPKGELNEVNNKLAALKQAIVMANTIS